MDRSVNLDGLLGTLERLDGNGHAVRNFLPQMRHNLLSNEFGYEEALGLIG